MRTMMSGRHRNVVAGCLMVLGVSGACVRQQRETPRGVPPPGRVGAEPHRPIHKGYIDTSTGVYVREDDDLVIDGPMPIVLRRTYQSADHISRQFGIATTHPGEWWIYGDSDPRVPWGELILSQGARVRFTRISPGNTQKGAVLRHDTSFDEFQGALLTWSGSTWDMTFADGSLAIFSDCTYKTDTCALLERRDPSGHRICYVRDESKKLLRMESEGRGITFEYDDRKRVVRAFDTAQHSVRYTYDEKGRLVRASYSDGSSREYGYDDANHLIRIRDPHRIVQNWYESGRVVRQEVRSSEDDDDPYVATARYVVENDLVVEVDFDEGNGVERTRFNRDHHVVSQTYLVKTPAPITFSYSRDAKTNAVLGATLTCAGVSGPVERTVPLTSPFDDQAKAILVREHCTIRR